MARPRWALRLKAAITLVMLAVAIWSLIDPVGQRDWTFLAIAIFMAAASALFLWQLSSAEAIEYGPGGLALLDRGKRNEFPWHMLESFTAEPVRGGPCVLVTLADGVTLPADLDENAFVLTGYAMPAHRLARELTQAKERWG